MTLRKLFSLALAFALLDSAAVPAHAELLKNFKTDSSIEVKTFGIDNETDANPSADDYRSATHTRILVGGSFDLLDDVHGRVLLRKNNRVYGQTGENLNSVQTAIAVDNAYTKIDKVFGRVDLTMGRQFYGDSEDPNIYFGVQPDDILSVTALDAFRADADIMGWAKFEGIAGKTVESTPVSATAPAGPTNANSDTDLWGGKLSSDKLIPKGSAGLSYYTRKAKGAGATQNNTLNVLQVCAAGDILAGLGYHADFMQNFGRNNAAAGTPAYDGSAYIIGLKYGHDISNMPFRAKAEYGRGSRDFASIAAGKRFGIIWGEHSNAGPSTYAGGTAGAGLTNLKVADVSLGINPIAKLGIDVSWYRFMRDNGDASGALGYANSGKTSIGTEYDLVVSWKHSDNVSLEASAATFQVGDALSNGTVTPTAPITRLGADVKIKF